MFVEAREFVKLKMAINFSSYLQKTLYSPSPTPPSLIFFSVESVELDDGVFILLWCFFFFFDWNADAIL